MRIIIKYGWLVVVALAILAGISSFFVPLYQRDVKALTDFSTSYETFDKAISDFSADETSNSQERALNALAELDMKASFKISSLIKYEKELMSQAREVADLSKKELDSLGIYIEEIKSRSAGLDKLAEEYIDLNNRRKAAYARFQELVR